MTENAKTRLDTAEQLARIIAVLLVPALIPLTVAIYTNRIQQTSQRESINRDYVQLAVSILKEKSTDVSPSLRSWAVDLLAAHSPTRFGVEVIADLKSGEVKLPSVPVNTTASNRAAVVSPSGFLAAYVENRRVFLKDVRNAKANPKFLFQHPEKPVSLDFSPKDQSLAVAGESGTVIVWSLSSLKETQRFKVSQPLYSARFMPDSRIEAVSVSGNIFFYDLGGKLVGQFVTPNPPSNITVVTQ